MRIPEETICKFCSSVFCCSQCRHKHEIKNHAIVVHKPIIMTTTTKITTKNSIGIKGTTTAAIAEHPNENSDSEAVVDQAAFETIYLFCPICAKQPLPLQQEIYKEMLIHVETHHLPLRCEKCSKMYNTIDDLREFNKCMKPNSLCTSRDTVTATNHAKCYYGDDTSKITVTKAMASNHNSPMRRQEFNDSHLTPISIINMRWKAKNAKASHEEFISDSVSSIKNISSISNTSSSIRRSIGVASAVKGKVIRTTSTPVHLEMMFAKPKEQTFNATGCGHMSSIQYNSGCESETSPALSYVNSQALEPINRYRKVAGARPKITAVTPLRHVMSKSIQKAFAEHGLPAASTAVRGGTVAFQRKNMFDTTTSPSLDCNNDYDNKKHLSPVPPPLDLRLSPAVRRSQAKSEDSLPLQNPKNDQQKQINDLPKIRRNILLSAQKLTTESIVITRTAHLSSVSASTSSTSASSSSSAAASTSGLSSHGGSINTIKPHLSINSSYQSSTSNSSGGGVFKSCSSVEIITATTTEEIQQVEAVETLSTNNNLVPHTPITRIPGALIHKKLINFETPTVEHYDSRESHNSPGDVFFTPNSTPMQLKSFDGDSANNEPDSMEKRNRKLMVKQNLNGRFSQLRKPSLKECTHSTAFSRIENLTINSEDGHDDYADDVEDDDVFVPEEKEKVAKTEQKQNTGGLWSIMSSVMGMPLRKNSVNKISSQNESSKAIDSHSKSLIKRCASIAGSLVRPKPLMDENDLQTLKRKRTFTMDEQTSSSYFNLLNNSDAISPNMDSFNTSSKRLRIQGRRPIDRMRFNS